LGILLANPNLEVFYGRQLEDSFVTVSRRLTADGMAARAVERLRGCTSSEVLLGMILLHVGRGYSLRETAVQSKLANWADISDVVLRKRLRQSEEWLRSLCIELLKENGGSPVEHKA
jgi:hypothetical protein